jgi:hypothetical protein
VPVRRDPRNDRWFFRTTVRFPGGKRKRLFGVPGVPGAYHRFPNTKVGAQTAEQLAVQQAFGFAGDVPQKVEVPTFTEWFKGRFWQEWVVGRKNKPTEVRSKNIIFEKHLEPRFGEMRLDEITTSEVARFRALLVVRKLSEKRSTTSWRCCRSR